MVFKQQTQEVQHKEILVLIAFQRAAMALTSIGIMQSSQSLRFTHAQSMEVEEVSDKAFDLLTARWLRKHALRVISHILFSRTL